MEIIKDNVQELLDEANYAYENKYLDNQLNCLFNYWCFFDQEEKKIQELTGASLEIILYSKYYWSSRYKEKFNELYGSDMSIEQQQYKILEDMDQRINRINWDFIQKIEQGTI